MLRPGRSANNAALTDGMDFTNSTVFGQSSTADDPGPLRGMPAVVALHDAGGGKWEVELRDGTDPQSVLQGCFEKAVRLRSFDAAEASLHDVFVKLVGSDAREASFR